MPLVLAAPERAVDVTELAALYMVAAIAAGRAAAVFAAVGAFLAFGVFFIEPCYALTVEDLAERVTLLVLLGTGLVLGQLASSALCSVAHAITTGFAGARP